MLVASMPVLEDNLVYWIPTSDIREHQPCVSLYGGSRITLVFTWDVFGDTSYIALNPATGFGLLRERGADERPHPREVAIFEALPNELPRVAGIISTVPQTPLSARQPARRAERHSQRLHPRCSHRPRHRRSHRRLRPL